MCVVWCRHFLGALTVILVGGSLSPVVAQDIVWQHDYAQARQTASSLNRPLLVDVGGRDCLWCQKLDATTFKDGAVASAIARTFVPIKLDAERDAVLVKAMNVTTLPTLVFAAPDGTILHVVQGYVDAATLQQHIKHFAGLFQEHQSRTQRSPSKEPTPEPTFVDPASSIQWQPSWPTPSSQRPYPYSWDSSPAYRVPASSTWGTYPRIRSC